MKRKKQTLDYRLGPVRVGISELRHIVDILAGLPNNKGVAIEAEEFEFSTLEEVLDLKTQHLSQIKISTTVAGESWASAMITIQPGSVWLYATSDEPVVAGAIAKIEKILSRRQISSFLRFKYWGIVWWLTFSLGLFVTWLGLSTRLEPLMFIGLGVALITPVASLFGYLLTRTSRQSKIFLSHLNEVSTFWSRKKDDILINVLMVVLGIAGTLFVQWIARMTFTGAAP